MAEPGRQGRQMPTAEDIQLIARLPNLIFVACTSDVQVAGMSVDILKSYNGHDKT